MQRANLAAAKAEKKGWGATRLHRRQPNTAEYVTPKELKTLAGNLGLGHATLQAAVRSSLLYTNATNEARSSFRHSARELVTIATALDHVFTDPELSNNATVGLSNMLEIYMRRIRCLKQHFAQLGSSNRSSTAADWEVAEGLESATTKDDMAQNDDQDLRASQQSVELNRKLAKDTGGKK